MTSRLRHEERAKLLVEVNAERAKQKPPLPPKKKFVWARARKRVPRTPRRMVECGGVGAIKKWPAEGCSRIVLEKGRRRGTCGTCYVLRVWRERLAWADAGIVVKIMAKLAAQGRI